MNIDSKELDRFFDLSLDLIAIADTNGFFRRLNPQWEKVLGFETKELEGTSFLDLVHPDDKAATTETIRVLKGGKEVTNFVNRYRCRDGSYRWIEWRSRSWEGELIYAAARDITEWKNLVAELKQSELQYRHLYEVMMDGFVQVDLNGRIIKFNKEYRNLLGYDDETLLKMNFRDITPEKWRRFEDEIIIPQVLKRGYSEIYEKEYIRSNGEIIPIEIRTHLLTDQQGNPSGLWGIVRNITPRKQAEDDRQKIEAQIQQVQKLESLGVLAGGMAHDFNNLLVAILGYAELALLQISSDSPIYTNLNSIVAAVNRAADLCKQMLAYAGKGRFQPRIIDLSQIVIEMTSILKVSVSKKIALDFSFGRNLPAIEADETQIRQIIMNLIINAAEAIGNNDGNISIITNAIELDASTPPKDLLKAEFKSGLYTYLEITDTGCGINAEMRNKIFDPFYTTKFTGRGLGLAAVLGIVRGHRGYIEVDSEIGRGTKFRILFPSVMKAPGRGDVVETTASSWVSNGTILVVDDDESVCLVLQEIVKHMGFDVLLAKDGRQAIEIFKRNTDNITCIMLDLTMPGMDGIETAMALRALGGKGTSVPIVMTSGYNEQDVSQHISFSEITGFMQKPFNYKAVEKKLREIVGS